jgi:hypothetical protein
MDPIFLEEVTGFGNKGDRSLLKRLDKTTICRKVWLKLNGRAQSRC